MGRKSGAGAIAFQNKTRPDAGDVSTFLAAVEPAGRREDATLLLDLMQRASGEPPVLWGSMIGFGHYSYRTDSGHKGEMFLTGFAPRKANMVVHIMPGFKGLAGDLKALGPHKTGKSCLYLGRLFLIETWDAPGSQPDRRSDFRLPEGARRIDNPAAFGLGQIPEGYVPYLAPQGTIHLFKDPRGASTFAPSALNPE